MTNKVYPVLFQHGIIFKFLPATLPLTGYLNLKINLFLHSVGVLFQTSSLFPECILTNLKNQLLLPTHLKEQEILYLQNR